MKNYLKKIYTQLLPFSCILCKHPSRQTRDICIACQLELPSVTQTCTICAKPLSHITLICGNCLADPPSFTKIYTLYLYQPPLIYLIWNLKFQHNLVHAKVLGELMAAQIKLDWYHNRPLPEVIIPVPLHTKRLRERGFNQALEIAKPIAKILKIPIDYSTCIRVKETQSQTRLSAKEREKNLHNAFAMAGYFPYKHVAILDDVITTGQTIRELSTVLKASGVETIDVWCCARAALNLETDILR